MRILLLLIFCSLAVTSLAKEEEKTKYRKMQYTEFLSYSINDTANIIINLFFDNKSNAVVSQMSYLPVALPVYFIFPPLGTVLTAISLPLFIHGTLDVIKYRKKKLAMILIKYNATGELSSKIRKKVIKKMKKNESLNYDY
jgi:hypothetical protein